MINGSPFVRSIFLARLGPATEWIYNFSTLFIIGSLLLLAPLFPFLLIIISAGLPDCDLKSACVGEQRSLTVEKGEKDGRIKLEAKRGKRMPHINYTSIACLSICTLIINKTSPWKGYKPLVDAVSCWKARWRERETGFVTSNWLIADVFLAYFALLFSWTYKLNAIIIAKRWFQLHVH